MGLRQTLNANSKLAVLFVVGLLIVIAGVAWAMWPRSHVSNSGVAIPDRAFFSSDEGKSWYVGDAAKIPPFEEGGKQVLRAYVFKGADGKLFLSCVGRFTPAVKKELEAAYARQPGNLDPLMIRQLELDGLEVKAPDQGTWLKRSDPQAANLVLPRLPDGSYAEPAKP